ncbi:MAG: hypothetical protein AAB974_02450 [Patescibacteria group bacterium]
MTTKSDFRVLGLAHKLGLAWEKEGGTLAEMNTLAEDGSMLRDLLMVVRGKAEVRIKPRVIDCSVTLFIQGDYSICEEDQIKSRFTGKLVWDTATVALYLGDDQKNRMVPKEEVLKDLQGQKVLPANVLDCLRSNPTLIPSDWKGKTIYFWGTIYCDSNGDRRLVRSLDWDDFTSSWIACYSPITGWNLYNSFAIIAR